MADVEFRVKIRGYDSKEVDAYIKKLRDEFAEVCVHLQAKIKTLEESARSQEEIAQTMMSVQSIVQKMEQEGKEKAERLLSDAQMEADQVVRNARYGADKTVGDARAEADRLISEAGVKASSIKAMAEVESERTIRQSKQYYSEIQEKMQQIYNISSLFLTELKETAPEMDGEEMGNTNYGTGYGMSYGTNQT